MADVTGPRLTVDGLVAGYGRGPDIVRDLSIVVEPGTIVGLIGPNGAGKSTVLKSLFGVTDVRAGRVALGADDVTGLAGHDMVRRGVGYVPQRLNVFPRLTVAENLRVGAYQRPELAAAGRERVAEHFPQVAARLGDRAGTLSGGERQMLAIGRALMASPSLLLLDEPSANLATGVADDLFEAVVELARTGVSILIVEQNALRCLEICDHAHVLEQGTSAIDGPGSELLADPSIADLYLGGLAAD